MMYQISEGELNQLQSNLTELKADSGQKRFDVPTARREVDINEWYEDEDE